MKYPQEVWFIDGSIFVQEWHQKTGYAIVSSKQVIEANPLPQGALAQQAELIALTKTSTLGKDKRLNVYTDSRYTFVVLHAHASIWKQRVLLTNIQSTIKHRQEILQLLETLCLPRKVSVIVCKGHQRDVSQISLGNQKTAREDKRTALWYLKTVALFPIPEEQLKPFYIHQEDK